MTQTDYYVKRVLDAVFNEIPFTVGEAYVGLATSTYQAEVSAADYTRRLITWTESTDTGLIMSTGQVTWMPVTEWGTIAYAILMDASQGGNVLFYDAVGPVPGTPGLAITIDAGDLLVT